jgi:hypothetical protein
MFLVASSPLDLLTQIRDRAGNCMYWSFRGTLVRRDDMLLPRMSALQEEQEAVGRSENKLSPLNEYWSMGLTHEGVLGKRRRIRMQPQPQHRCTSNARSPMMDTRLSISEYGAARSKLLTHRVLETEPQPFGM